jgi:Uma2 family endonuclease
MAIVIDDAYLPAKLSGQPMSDEQFAVFCEEHPDLTFEMTAEGEIIVMPPAFSFTGAQNSQITAQLTTWARKDGRGITLDSSTGYVLPNGARRSPDASWITKDRVAGWAQKGGFWHICPDFVIELRSETDRLSRIQKKMLEYRANGAQLGWLIDPQTRSVTIYAPNQEPRLVQNADSCQGEGPVDGFVLDLLSVWNPLS